MKTIATSIDSLAFLYKTAKSLCAVRKLRDRTESMTADDYLRLAVHSSSPATAAVLANKGLRSGTDTLDPEVATLLLREVFRAHLHAKRLRSAHAVARKMVRLGVLPEVAYADLGRACAALGWGGAVRAWRLAARHAPARRRSIHWASVASALHHAGLYEQGLSALERATRWSLSTRALHRAHAALIHLDSGVAVDEIDDLDGIVQTLEASRAGEGFGRYIVGLLHAAMGHEDEARKNLRHFLRRNAADPMRASTLAFEIARVRKTLRAIKTGRAPSTEG